MSSHDDVRRTGRRLREAEARVRAVEDALRRARADLRLAQDDRRRAVMEARAAGASYGEIADALGVSLQRARAIAADGMFKARRERLEEDIPS